MGGLTAGRTDSMYAFTDGYYGYAGIEGRDASFQTNTISYTLALGNGFSATLAVEDPETRREGLTAVVQPGTNATNAVGGWSAATLGSAATTGPTTGVGSIASGLAAANAYTGVNYAASRMPEFVANLRLDQSWGKIQLSGAVHEIRSSWAAVDNELGYAAQLATKINLPMLANGSSLTLTGGYSKGATAYTMANVASNNQGAFATNAANPFAAGTVSNYGGGTYGWGHAQAAFSDGAVDASGKLFLASVWSFGATLDHYFTPTVHGWLTGSYSSLSYPAGAQTDISQVAAAGDFGGNFANIDNSKLFRIAAGSEWTPVKGLALGAEVMYSQIDLKHGAYSSYTPTGANGNGAAFVAGAPIKQESEWKARIRVKRDF